MKAQLSFPNGKSIELVTDNGFLYMETRLIFHLGKHKADQYRYEKISDSIDSQWLLSSCFNGECRAKIEDSGVFMNELGINDSTCYIAFHVDTRGLSGKTVIKYRVANRYDSTEAGDLTFSITYTGPAGLRPPEAAGGGVRLYPNPAKTYFSIDLADKSIIKPGRLEVFSLSGQLVFSQETGPWLPTQIDISHLRAGSYLVRIPAAGGFLYKPLLIQ